MKNIFKREGFLMNGQKMKIRNGINPQIQLLLKKLIVLIILIINN